MNNLSSKNASKSYVTKCLNKDKKMDVQKMKHNYFGSKVENIFKMSRSEINKINDRWIPSHKLKSGRNRAGLHKSIKDFYMNVYDIPQRAKKSADRRSKYLKKKRCGDENEDDDDEESDEEDDDETRGLDHMVEDIQSFNDKDKLRSVKENELISSTDANTYFPEWWLSFLILGMPNLIDYGTKNSFSSGIHVDKKRKRSETSNFQGASKLYGGDKSSSMETIPGKGARQRLHEFANLNKESSNTNNVEPLKEPIHKKIVREIQMAEVKKTKFEIDLELIDKEIELMIQLKESENEIDNLRREKLAIIKNQRRQNNN